MSVISVVNRECFRFSSSFKRYSLLFCVAFCCVLFSQNAEATSVIQLNESQMVEFSTFIIRGKVVSQRAIPGPRGMGIVTLVTIRVAEELVGRSKPKEVVVRHFGGQIGTRKVAMPGGPSFTTGNEVVVFVQKSKYLPQGEFLLVGLTQGKFLVVRPSAHASFPQGIKQPLLVRNLNHVKMYNVKGAQVAVPAGKQLTLAAMRTRLQGYFKLIQARRKAHVLKLPKVKKRLPNIKIPNVKPQGIQVPIKIVPKPNTPKK